MAKQASARTVQLQQDGPALSSMFNIFPYRCQEIWEVCESPTGHGHLVLPLLDSNHWNRRRPDLIASLLCPICRAQGATVVCTRLRNRLSSPNNGQMRYAPTASFTATITRSTSSSRRSGCIGRLNTSLACRSETESERPSNVLNAGC